MWWRRRPGRRAWFVVRYNLGHGCIGIVAAATADQGVVGDDVILDLDYSEDSNAEVDMNLVMSESGSFVEVQGTAEGLPFNDDQLARMLELGRKGCMELIDAQREALGL